MSHQKVIYLTFSVGFEEWIVAGVMFFTFTDPNSVVKSLFPLLWVYSLAVVEVWTYGVCCFLFILCHEDVIYYYFVWICINIFTPKYNCSVQCTYHRTPSNYDPHGPTSHRKRDSYMSVIYVILIYVRHIRAQYEVHTHYIIMYMTHMLPSYDNWAKSYMCSHIHENCTKFRYMYMNITKSYMCSHIRANI